MGLKIKWNDDRVTEALRAIQLIGRDRLARGEATDVVRASLAEYRADPAGYKARKGDWADVREAGDLKQPAQVAAYHNLQGAIVRLTDKMARAKRQFNSLTELDNALIASLEIRASGS
jgi:hypothetical protein